MASFWCFPTHALALDAALLDLVVIYSHFLIRLLNVDKVWYIF